MEFHVSRVARERYGLDAPWFSLTGNVVLADLAVTRRMALRMNQARTADPALGPIIHAGDLHAMGLIDEILHFVAALYREQRKPDVLALALAALEKRLGREKLDALLLRFVESFPPLAVYRGEADPGAYLRGATAGVPHRQLALEELLLLWLANVNPAFNPFGELFDDEALAGTAYEEAMRALSDCFAGQPVFGPDHQTLVDMLRSPALHSPHSLYGQLDYIRTRWASLLGEFLKRLLITLDVMREEERAAFLRFAHWTQTQHSPVTTFRGLEHEPERFTPDRDWMPRVVMIAKSVNVWLDQLARRYRCEVARLDQVPDEELDLLARWGFSALWLIGVWERSRASRRVKQMTGNPDADASAYSLFDYVIAEALGGDAAYENLRERAWRRGIRLASDMVPNHMGIDSRWVVEHPDWFLALEQPPYPAYGFNGPDLSWDPRVGIQIEDHYYDRTDAAVVFKRHDRHTGAARYIYHGNDGTLMPWNDTAQLDYLKPEVREGVIQTILHVARHFSIIRFDAAMTLAKRHYQRLWYPEPGTGGAIPSRAERGLTKEEFDRAMPIEFWREVVDRIAAEMPDTLLLAEAFWLMEGYFVRSLGMHRVYNSAFMNMLRDEQNANYRSVIKNTLEFDAEILKRYVNFMNNPDERTAVDQFGKDEKYFGVCTLMVTLPGLPMFGHGQIEGFTERYGMEFRRASWEESPDRWLIERHEREIFPLVHRRHLFAEVADFQLYDFFTSDGRVNEDVFAYSNRRGDERALVLYHNRYATTSGWIRTSVGRAVKTGRGDEKRIEQRTLGEGLGLEAGEGRYCSFRDHLSGLEYLRSCQELIERGLFAQLEAYRCHVFLDFRELTSDAAHPWAQLAHELGGRPVPNLGEALLEIQLRPVTAPLRELINAPLLRELLETRLRARAARAGARPPSPAGGEARPAPRAAEDRPGGDGEASPLRARARALMEDVERRLERLLLAARTRAGGTGSPIAVAREARAKLVALLGLETEAPEDADPIGWGTLIGWALLHAAGKMKDPARPAALAREWMHAWRWDRTVAEALRELGVSPGEAARATGMIEALIAHGPAFRLAALEPAGAHQMVEAWLEDAGVQQLLQLNQYEGSWWIHRESWNELLQGLAIVAAIENAVDPTLGSAQREPRSRAALDLARRMTSAAEESGYRLDHLLARVTA